MPSIDQFLTGRQELFEQLRKIVSEGATSNQITQVIESLKTRSGSFGMQRKDLINSLFKGIVDLSFPSHIKYLFWGSQNDKGLFEDPEEAKQEKSKKAQKP